MFLSAFGLLRRRSDYCHRVAIILSQNKYGTRTGVAELMCEWLGGDCSQKRLYIVCIFIFKLGSVLVCILEFSVRKHFYKLCLGMMGDSPKYGG